MVSGQWDDGHMTQLAESNGGRCTDLWLQLLNFSTAELV